MRVFLVVSVRERIEENWKLARETDQTDIAGRSWFASEAQPATSGLFFPPTPRSPNRNHAKSLATSGSRNQEDSQTCTGICITCITFTLKYNAACQSALDLTRSILLYIKDTFGCSWI